MTVDAFRNYDDPYIGAPFIDAQMFEYGILKQLYCRADCIHTIGLGERIGNLGTCYRNGHEGIGVETGTEGGLETGPWQRMELFRILYSNSANQYPKPIPEKRNPLGRSKDAYLDRIGTQTSLNWPI
jgi:hypothetical protein